MTYTPSWSQSDGNGLLTAGAHAVYVDDLDELLHAVNRRRRLTYQADASLSLSETISKAPVQSLRQQVLTGILEAAPGGLGGAPATPEAMAWLWTGLDADAGKTIVSDNPGTGQAALLDKIGSGAWTDPTLTSGRTPARAVHLNELRQAITALIRGRWTLPIYFSAGIFSPMPDTAWFGEYVANNGTDELRSLGFIVPTSGSNPVLGLTEVTVRNTSRIELTADTDCSVDLHRCLRPLNWYQDLPTWNHYDSGTPQAWASAGGLGTADAASIGSLTLTANQPGSLSGSAVAAAYQAVLDGAEPNLLARRTDTGSETVHISGRATIEFDLDSPPN